MNKAQELLGLLEFDPERWVNDLNISGGDKEKLMSYLSDVAGKIDKDTIDTAMKRLKIKGTKK